MLFAILPFIALLLASANPTKAASTSTDGYLPQPDSTVFCMTTQSDGKLLVGGAFTQLFGTSDGTALARQHIARILSDGSIDTTFAPGTNANVYTIAIQTDGKVLVGGNFTTATSSGSTSSVARSFIARFNSDGSLDTGFSPSISHSWAPNGQIYAIAYQLDGKILVGGNFDTVQGTGATSATTTNYLVRLNADGSIDTSFKVVPNGLVTSFAFDVNGNILIGGGFTSLTYGDSKTVITRKRIARLTTNGLVDTSFDPAADNLVNTILPLPDGSIVFGGQFATIRPNNLEVDWTAPNLAKVHSDGSVDAAFVAMPNGVVLTLALQKDGQIAVGGKFSGIKQGISSSYILARYLGRISQDGLVDTAYVATGGSYVTSLAPQDDGKLIVGGYFSNFNAKTPSNVPLGAFLVRLNQDGSSDRPLNPGTGSLVFSAGVTQPDGSMVLAGTFSCIAGMTQTNITRLLANGTVDSSFTCSLTGSVSTISLQSDGKILLGGAITKVNGDETVTDLVRLNKDGSLDTSFLPNVNGSVDTIAIQTDGKIIIGGQFTYAGNVARNYIARINADGSLDTAFDPKFNSSVNSVALTSTGQILVAGSFTSLTPNGATSAIYHNYFLRLNADGTYDKTFDVAIDAAPNVLIVKSDNSILLAGSFTGIRGHGTTTATSHGYIARLTADGSVDSKFVGFANAGITHMKLMADGRILITGSFTEVNYITRYRVAKLNAEDGFPDASFNPNTNGTVYVTLPRDDGKVVIAGSFSSLRPSGAGQASSRASIALIDAWGNLDPSFMAVSPLTNSGTINTVLSLRDSSIVVAGSFTNFAGASSHNMARLDSSGSVDESFYATPNGRVLSVLELPQNSKTEVYSNRFAWYKADSSTLDTSAIKFTSNVGRINLALPLSDGRVLIAGQFTLVAGSLTNLAIIKPDGTADTSFAPQPNGEVTTVVRQSDGKFLIGGSFTSIGSADAAYIARLNPDGSSDTSFADPGLGSTVNAIAVASDGRIIVGGEFTTVSNNTDTSVTRNHILRLSSAGVLDTSFNPNCDAAVTTISIQDNGLITLGGNFTTLTPNSATSSTSRNYFARINVDGSLDTTYDPNLSTYVNCQALQSDGKIIIGGAFLSAKPNSSTSTTLKSYIMRLNTDGTVDSTFVAEPDGAVNNIKIASDGSVYLSGSFVYMNVGADSVYRPFVAHVSSTGVLDKTFAPDANNAVTAIGLMSNGTVVLGGVFSSLDTGNVFLVGGEFSEIGTTSRPYLALVSGRGQILESFNALPDAAVRAMVRQPDTKLVVAGSFTTISGTARAYIARLDKTGAVDASFKADANAPIYALGYQADGKILVAGDFDTIGGVSRNGLARLNTDGSIDSSFNVAVKGRITAITFDANNNIYLGGSFTDIAGSGKSYIARVSSAGVLDTSFSTVTDGPVYAITTTVGGRITIGGSFSKVGTKSCSNIAQLTATGALIENSSISANQPVYALATAYDGKQLAGGSFTRFGGKDGYLLGRISNSEVIGNTLRTNPDHNSLTWTRGAGSPTISQVSFEYSNDSLTWTTLGTASVNADASVYTLSGLSLPTYKTSYLRVRGYTSTNQNNSMAIFEAVRALYVDASVSFPNSAYVIGNVGTALSYGGVAAHGNLRFSSTTLPDGMTLDTITGRLYGTPTKAGTSVVTVTYTDGYTIGSYTQTIVIADKSTGPLPVVSNQRLLAYSTRGTTTAANPLILGFVVKGDSPMPVLLRAIGPSLSSYNVTGFVTAPKGVLYNASNTKIKDLQGQVDTAGNLVSESARIGAAPLASSAKDTAQIITLQPGAYTFVVSDANGASGQVLAEIFDANAYGATNPSRLSGCSTRGAIGSSKDRLIPGYVIDGDPLSRVLLRAIGPSLPATVVSDVLNDPSIILHLQNGTSVAVNDDWYTQSVLSTSWVPGTGSEIALAAPSLGASTLSTTSKDSALLLTMPAGVYTMEVASDDTDTGTVLVEIFLP